MKHSYQVAIGYQYTFTVYHWYFNIKMHNKIISRYRRKVSQKFKVRKKSDKFPSTRRYIMLTQKRDHFRQKKVVVKSGRDISVTFSRVFSLKKGIGGCRPQKWYFGAAISTFLRMYFKVNFGQFFHCKNVDHCNKDFDYHETMDTFLIAGMINTDDVSSSKIC